MSAPAAQFRVRPAERGDLPAIERLLVARELPTEGVPEHLADFLVVERGRVLLGCAGFEQYGRNGLLRSVAVDASSAGQGLGRALVEAAISRAENRRIQTLYLLTTTAGEYFSRLGFEVISRDALPGELGASAELRGACPSSAAAMRRTLHRKG